MSTQFVTCGCTSCPMNELKTCRSPHIEVDINGFCSIINKGVFEQKSSTDTYVELTQCDCKKCHYWVLDEARQTGQCGFNEDLHFLNLEIKDKNAPACMCFIKQINQPEFAANLD